MKTLLALLLFPSIALAQTVIVVPNNTGSAPAGYSMADSVAAMTANLNWNVERNAAIGDAIRQQQLMPPVKIQVETIEKHETVPSYGSNNFGATAPSEPHPINNLDRMMMLNQQRYGR